MPLAIPGSAPVSMVMNVMAKLATSQSMAAQLASAQTLLSPGATTVNLIDKSGIFETFDVSEDVPDGGYLDLSVARAQVADSLEITPPFPAIQIIGMGGARNVEEADWEEFAYRVSVIALCGGDREPLVQRQAVVTAECYARLMRRDTSLGGLVKTVRQLMPVEPGGGGRLKDANVVMTARAIFEFTVILP